MSATAQEPIPQVPWYTLLRMRLRTYKSITFVLAVLFALSSWVPMPGRAEAQMRCVGASPHSAPCARTVLPAAGLTEAQVYTRLIPCCRSMRVSTLHCSMPHSVQPMTAGTAPHRSSLSARRCLITIHVTVAGVTAPAVSRTRWFLTANPALAPPVPVQPAFALALFTCPACRTGIPTLSPHALPCLRGLRAPPTV